MYPKMKCDGNGKWSSTVEARVGTKLICCWPKTKKWLAKFHSLTQKCPSLIDKQLNNLSNVLKKSEIKTSLFFFFVVKKEIDLSMTPWSIQEKIRKHSFRWL